MKTVYFIRHGYAEHNELFDKIGERAFFEMEDPRLVELGKTQANNVKHEFKDIEFDVIYCSPSTRCIETANILFENKDIILHDLLLEPQGHHLCNKRSSHDVLKHDCVINNYNFDHIDKDYSFIIETDDDIIDRVNKFYDIIVNNTHENIMVVAHYTIIHYFFKHKMDLYYKPNNCEIKKIII